MDSGKFIGCFAVSLAGHDKGDVFVIVGIKGAYALIADGVNRSVANPKKKNVKHLQIDKSKSVMEMAGVKKSGADNGLLTDDIIRKALLNYKTMRKGD